MISHLLRWGGSLLKKIRKWLLERHASGEYLPQSPMGQASTHVLKIWRNLCMYLRDGRIPIDNNLAENAIRPIALGRKNWIFLGDDLLPDNWQNQRDSKTS